ncbi:alpha/beta fold hydrolase [Anaeromicropila herbilytica]|uniref:Alpha/beta hydrolase n=1 Tax=Anaeromicropila herbilytica TaxID=2785025 RepID=A0A7R7ID97_9FIRM|nr:alpha/beta hydrolase [Anaeromicropila herbilytica]BCN30814.1 hypothetical protein bsdtb5_21090 [Anaeromicropila herbilytica]
MKKGLFLYGLNCTLDIWSDMIQNGDIEGTFIEYPHEITQNAHRISNITEWVYSEYGKNHYDYIVGHSMGGIIALELIAKFQFQCSTVIFIESNLRPAKEFYRNLMLPNNMIQYGDKVMNMMQNESSYYTEDLKISLKENFDYSSYISEISCKIYGIYGDRGIEEYSKRIEDLCLDKEIEEKIDFKFIKNSCHMPMIENPKELAEVLVNCIE